MPARSGDPVVCDVGAFRDRAPIRCRGGFTIIEMVVVMLILAVATAVTIPALLPPPQDDDVTAATRQLDLLFQTARDSAARAGRDVIVAIDSATGGVWLMTDADADATYGPPRGPAVRAPGVTDAGPGQPLGLPASIRLELTKSRARFRFTPTGAAIADSLMLRTPQGVLLITIDPWTGHALLH